VDNAATFRPCILKVCVAQCFTKRRDRGFVVGVENLEADLAGALAERIGCAEEPGSGYPRRPRYRLGPSCSPSTNACPNCFHPPFSPFNDDRRSAARKATAAARRARKLFRKARDDACGKLSGRTCAPRSAALRRWREHQDVEREFFGADYHPGDYVFTFEDGRPPHPDTIRQRFDRLAAAAGLSRITFHDLRHSYATGALKAGVSPKILSERIGHADVGFFFQTYAHVITNDDREAAEQAASFLIGDGWDPEPDDEQG
jgi:Phage integrase family